MNQRFEGILMTYGVSEDGNIFTRQSAERMQQQILGKTLMVSADNPLSQSLGMKQGEYLAIESRIEGDERQGQVFVVYEKIGK